MTTLLITIAIVVAILITVLSEKGELGWSIFVIATGIFTVHLLDSNHTIRTATSYISNNIYKVIAGTLIHVALGVFWSILKWRWHCIDYWATHKVRSTDYFDETNPSYNEARITGWMIWWPFSFSWWVLHESITRFYNFLHIYNFLHRNLLGVFSSISKSAKENALKKQEKS